MKTRILAALAVLMALVSATAVAAEDSVFSDFDGTPRSIESYTGDGQWLVVMIWAHDCHVCNMEAESYAQFHETHKDGTARVLGISLDGAAAKAEISAFVEKHALPFPNLIGEPQTTMLYYQMLTGARFLGTPTILLYDPSGKLRAAEAGAIPTQIIEQYIADNSKPAG
jgi:peroxiredoxin